MRRGKNRTGGNNRERQRRNHLARQAVSGCGNAQGVGHRMPEPDTVIGEENMDGTNGISVGEARALLHDLRGGARGVRAPRSLAPGVLTRAGLGDAYWLLDTLLGPVYVAYNNAGVSAVMRAEEHAAFEERFRARFKRPIHPVAPPPDTVARAVAARLAGDPRARARFDLRSVSEFERAVLLKALEIPRGEVRPYGWIAREIARPKAVRAVGSALAHNPIPLLIPCHRVVQSDGRLGQYSLGGPTAKRIMLEAEGVDPTRLEELAKEGVRYIGSDTTHVYCLPTCRHARRISEEHRVPFRSDVAATTAGYRACKVCRPAA